MHLDSQKPGVDTILAKGPKGHLEWLSDGKGGFSVKPLGKPLEHRRTTAIGMMAGRAGRALRHAANLARNL